MAKFEYTATNKADKAVKGTVIADSKESAAQTLIKKGYKPLLVRPVRTGFNPNDIKLPGKLGEKRVKTKDTVVFTRQLSTMINAGVPLVRALATLQLQTDNETLKDRLQKVSKDVESGMSFADSLEKHSEIFGPIYINMVRAGEAGGILDEILKRLALQQEKDASIRKKVKGAMTYPAILTIIMIGAFVVLMTFVVPTIGNIVVDLAGEDTELPPQTRLLIGLSDFMVQYWYIMLGVTGLSLFAIKRYISTPSGKYQFHRLLLKTPILGNLIAKVAIARFARVFSSLMSSGVAVIESINVTANAIGNLVIEKELKDASKAVQNGKQLSEPLSDSKVFPPIVAQMLAIGEETGQTDTILIKVADFYEEEVDTVIDALSSIIEPIMIVIMGGMVGVIASAVLGPISELANNISIIILRF